jgi:hypothetical protein
MDEAMKAGIGATAGSVLKDRGFIDAGAQCPWQLIRV